MSDDAFADILAGSKFASEGFDKGLANAERKRRLESDELAKDLALRTGESQLAEYDRTKADEEALRQSTKQSLEIQQNIDRRKRESDEAARLAPKPSQTLSQPSATTPQSTTTTPSAPTAPTTASPIAPTTPLQSVVDQAKAIATGPGAKVMAPQQANPQALPADPKNPTAAPVYVTGASNPWSKDGGPIKSTGNAEHDQIIARAVEDKIPEVPKESAIHAIASRDGHLNLLKTMMDAGVDPRVIKATMDDYDAKKKENLRGAYTQIEQSTKQLKILHASPDQVDRDLAEKQYQDIRAKLLEADPNAAIPPTLDGAVKSKVLDTFIDHVVEAKERLKASTELAAKVMDYIKAIKVAEITAEGKSTTDITEIDLIAKSKGLKEGTPAYDKFMAEELQKRQDRKNYTRPVTVSIQQREGEKYAGYGPTDELNPNDESAAIRMAKNGTRETVSVRNPGASVRNARADYFAANYEVMKSSESKLGLGGGKTTNEIKSDAKAMEKAKKDFSPGGSVGKNITPMNTATDHIGHLETMIDNLENTNSPAYNTAKNYIKKQLGAATAENFGLMGGAVANEVERLLKGGVATAGEIEQIKAAFSAAKSPEQLKGAIDIYKKIIGGRINALQTDYQYIKKGGDILEERGTEMAKKLLRPYIDKPQAQAQTQGAPSNAPNPSAKASASGAVIVKSQADYDALKPGEKYKDQQGNIRVKGGK